MVRSTTDWCECSVLCSAETNVLEQERLFTFAKGFSAHIYIVTFSGNFNCVVCFIAASVFCCCCCASYELLWSSESEVARSCTNPVVVILSECCGRVASNWLFAVAHLLCCSVAVRAQCGANNDCVTFIIECLACRGRFGLHFKHFVNI